MKVFENISTEKLQDVVEYILSKLAAKNNVIALYGDLGAGKTTFSSTLINKIIGNDTVVTSPTFNLVHLYDCKQGKIWHFDLYRLKSQHEIHELGIDDAFSDYLAIIEWPEIIEGMLPKNTLRIKLEFMSDSERKIIIS